MLWLIWFKMSWWQHWLCFLFFTHEIKVMFCMKILGVVSDEVLNVFHSCFAVANQRLEFVLKFRNLEVLSSGSDWNSEIICGTKFPMKLASKGFEQNLQRHKESVRREYLFDLCSKLLITPSAAVSGRISPSWQCEHFIAEKYVPNSVTSQHLGHLQPPVNILVSLNFPNLHLKYHSSSMLCFLFNSPCIGET